MSELKIGDLVEQYTKLHGVGMVLWLSPPSRSTGKSIVDVHFFKRNESRFEFADELNLISRLDSI